MKNKVKIVPSYMYLPIILALVCNGLAYYGTRLFMSDRFHFNLSNAIDDKIPLVSWTIVIYIGCYIFWVINYILGCRQKEKLAYRFISADFLAKIVCFFCFILLPTTNVRPEITGTSIWDVAMTYLYRVDAADNLFPSIHCLTSWLCFIAVRKNEKIPKWYRIVSLLIAVSICISTLTTKQHVLIDVASGIALAEGSYWFVQKTGFYIWYEKFTNYLTRLIKGRRCCRQ